MTGRREAGAALLAVLWLTVILSFIGMALAASARTEVAATRNLVENEQGYFLARGGLEAAILHLTSPPPPPAEGEENVARRELLFEFETGAARVEVFPETAKLNVNTTPGDLLARLFTNLGLEKQEAADLAMAVDHWRSPSESAIPDALDNHYLSLPQPYRAAHHACESLTELLLVRGMGNGLFYGGFARVRRPPLGDLLTVVRNPNPAVNPNYAHPVLLASLPGSNDAMAAAIVRARERKPFRSMEEVTNLVGGSGSGTLGYLALAESKIYTLVAHGRARGAELESTVRLTLESDPNQPLRYRMLDWNQ